LLDEGHLGLRDLLRDALRGVRLHRLRSWLTAASFAAGTAAAIALFAMTGGARAELLRQIRALGADLVAVRAVGATPKGVPPALTFADARALAESFPFVRDVAPVREIESSVLLPDDRVSVRVVGTTPDYFVLRRMSFARGRAFSREESDQGRNVCVLGEETARRVALGRDPYGSLVKVGASWCRVIGIVSRSALLERAGGGGGGRADEPGRELYLPIATTLRHDLSLRHGLEEIVLRLDEHADAEAVAGVLRRALLRRHDGSERFEVATAEALLRQQRSARGLLDMLLACVALVALLLGGVGLASLSWQSVALRTREIAIRRAVGARRGEILAQFVLEGVLLALGGGVLGALAGAVGSGVVAAAGGWPWLLSLRQLLVVCGVALAIGVLATLYPARRAATLDPVAALRFDA
jgi:putative ABC transport system permease protein